MFACRSLKYFSLSRFLYPLLLSLLFVLMLCLQTRAAEIFETTSGTAIVVSGDGSTFAFDSDGTLSWSTGGLSAASVLTSSGYTLVGMSADGTSILTTEKSTDAPFLYTGSNYQTKINMINRTEVSCLSGISSDGLAVFGTIPNPVDSSNLGALWVTSDNWASLEGVTRYVISYGDYSSSVGDRRPTMAAVSNEVEGVRTVVGQRYDGIPVMWKTSGSSLIETQLSLEDSSDSAITFTNGTAKDITNDATQTVGWVTDTDENGFPTKHVAAKWSLDTNTNSLTVLPDGTYNYSYAYAINSDGSVIVGEVTSGGSQAAYWTGSGTSYTLHILYKELQNKGVTLSPSYLMIATGVSDDGSIIVGKAEGNNVFLARISDDSGASGVITLPQLNQSLADMGQVGSGLSGMGQLSMSRLGNVAVGQGMHFSVTGPGSGTDTGTGVGTERGLSSGDQMPGRLDVWLVGSLGTNIELDGDDLGLHGGLGLTWDNGQWRVGGGVFADSRDLDTDYDGNQEIKAVGPGAFVAYSPERTGLEFRLSALWQSVDLDLKRGYANGLGSAFSTGSTDAEIFGLSGRVQWTKDVNEYLAMTPFAEYTWQKTHIDGYSESDGPFPADFDSRDEESNFLRTGLRADVDLFDRVGTWGWVAWDHRFEDTSSGFGGTATGIGAFSYDGTAVDQDWIDTGVGFKKNITERFSATSSLGFAVGCDDDSVSDVTVTVGFSYQLM